MPRSTKPASDPADALPLDRSVGYQVRVTHKLIQRALQARVERHGVTLGMWYYLRALWVQDGVTQSELSAQIGTMEPTTLSAVAAMEQAGFVRRERHSTDRRKFQVFLTPAGQALRATLLPEAIDVIRVATGSLSAREVDAFLGTLKTIQQNLGAEGQKPRKPGADA